jgi:hypothetical protein
MLVTNNQLFPINKFKDSIWIFGALICLFGMIDRVGAILFDVLSKSYVSYLEFSYLLATASLLAGWTYLKPILKEKINIFDELEANRIGSHLHLHQDHAQVACTRMLELENHHIISQLHILPFPYISQIYHLLNLKHLETVHSNSLSSLKVIDVCNFQPTPLGGSVKFRTTLDSSISILKIWRQSIVDVELILHSPYMIELKIPMYGAREMIVIFRVFPLSNTTHEFFIDIYTDLQHPKLLLSAILHIASLFTLYEDLPYLKKLSERGLEGLIKSDKISSNKTMWLFKRFINLHGSKVQLFQAA